MELNIVIFIHSFLEHIDNDHFQQAQHVLTVIQLCNLLIEPLNLLWLGGSPILEQFLVLCNWVFDLDVIPASVELAKYHFKRLNVKELKSISLRSREFFIIYETAFLAVYLLNERLQIIFVIVVSIERLVASQEVLHIHIPHVLFVQSLEVI